jgi:hypothetical protein
MPVMQAEDALLFLCASIKFMNPTVSISSLHTQFKQWTRELIFYKEELRLLERRLGQCSLYAEHSTLSSLLYLQKKISGQYHSISGLQLSITAGEKEVGDFVQHISGMSTDSFRADDHTHTETQIQQIRNEQKAIKSSLFHYLAIH